MTLPPNEKSDKIRGKITAGVGGLYTVLTEKGEYTQCKARGNFRYKNISPYPGDNVYITLSENGQNTISEILDRKNFFSRPPSSNIDKLFITVACADPDPSYITVDKLICAAEYYSTIPVIIVTKSDLSPEKAKEIKNIYTSAGYSVFVTSSQNGEGLENLKSFVSDEIKGCTAVFTGESGVGKSSLMNSLFPNLKIATGEVSRKISRGKHTTRAVTLYPLDVTPNPDGAFLADTPGFGIFDISDIPDLYKEDVAELFKEFRPCLFQCKYTKCTHLREEGCAVLKAVNEGKISKERHESFVTIYEEIKKLRPFRTKKK